MDIISRLNWVDILVISLIFRISYVSFRDGLSHEIIPLFGAFLSLTVSICYYKPLTNVISQNIVKMPLGIMNFLSFIVIYFCVLFIFRFIRLLFNSIVKIAWHPFIEKFGGLLCGFAKASLITSAVLIMLVLLPLSYVKWSVVDRSFSGMFFLKIGPMVYSGVSGIFPALNPGEASSYNSSIMQELLTSSNSEGTTKKEVKSAPKWEMPFAQKKSW